LNLYYSDVVAESCGSAPQFLRCFIIHVYFALGSLHISDMGIVSEVLEEHVRVTVRLAVYRQSLRLGATSPLRLMTTDFFSTEPLRS
jgi:hypothetical protein